MNNYTPFLKLKSNEIMALKELSPSLQKNLIPFFDFPRDREKDESKFKNKAIKAVKSLTRNLKNIPNFYLDNYDIDDPLPIDGNENYKYLLDLFSDFSIIPVVGIDRSSDHIDSVIECKKLGVIKGESIAFRILPEDFDFMLVSDEIEDTLGEVFDDFESINLVFDCRVCNNKDTKILSTSIVEFIKHFTKQYNVTKIIVTGSSISASIGDIINTENEIELDRYELNIICNVRNYDKNIFIGDYTIVSPDYSDIDIPGNVMPNIMTPKTIYSFSKKHFIIRGGALKTHASGNKQFNEQARVIIDKPFYRGGSYSYGDKFIDDKSKNIGSNVMPGTIIKPTVNAHITFMLCDYTC